MVINLVPSIKDISLGFLIFGFEVWVKKPYFFGMETAIFSVTKPKSFLLPIWVRWGRCRRATVTAILKTSRFFRAVPFIVAAIKIRGVVFLMNKFRIIKIVWLSSGIATLAIFLRIDMKIFRFFLERSSN